MSSATERQNAIQSLNDSTQLLTDHTRLGREISIGKGLTSMARASASLGSREISRLLSRGVFTIHQPSGVFDNPLVGLNSEVQNELKTLNNLVLAILKNFDKTKNFIHGNDILGAETVLERLGQGLQEIDDLLGGNAFAGEDKDKMLLVRKDMETAILIVSQNLFKERVKMSASYVIATYSTVGNILSCLTAGGANLTPQLVNAIASICSSGCNVALMELESTGDVMEPESTGNGRRIRQTLGALDGTLEEVGRRGLMFPTDLDFKFIRAYNNLALAVLRGEDLEMGKRKLKKEEARENLWQALERIDELTGTGKVTDNTADGELERIKDDIAAAMEILDISLDSEATTKPIKVAGAGLSLAASIAGTIATFGTGAPVAIVPAVPVP